MNEGKIEDKMGEWQSSPEGLKSMVYHYGSHFLLTPRLDEAYNHDFIRKTIDTSEVLKERAGNEKLSSEAEQLIEKLQEAETSEFSNNLLNQIDEILEHIKEIK